tara:strand:+ start:332 stop:688 length:357 start_codon:yes stop_codon:yes gene_type:complete
MGEKSFSRSEHLKSKALIKEVFDKGSSLKGRLVKVFLLASAKERKTNRVAFIVKKALCYKKSTLRNRYKRLLKEAYRDTKHLFPKGFDIILLATNTKKHTKSTETAKDMQNVIKKYRS